MVTPSRPGECALLLVRNVTNAKPPRNKDKTLFFTYAVEESAPEDAGFSFHTTCASFGTKYLFVSPKVHHLAKLCLALREKCGTSMTQDSTFFLVSKDNRPNVSSWIKSYFTVSATQIRKSLISGYLAHP